VRPADLGCERIVLFQSRMPESRGATLKLKRILYCLTEKRLAKIARLEVVIRLRYRASLDYGKGHP
jgi:hypothetical protein